MRLKQFPRLYLFFLVVTTVSVVALTLAAEVPTIPVTLEPSKNLGVGFDLLPDETTEVSVVLNRPTGWDIVTNSESSKVTDKSGTTVWVRDSANTSQHVWKGYGIDANSPKRIINSGTYARFEGLLTKPFAGIGPAGATPFKVSVADLDIDADTGIPPRHVYDAEFEPHWEPYSDDSTAGRIEDAAEAGGPAAGLYLPASIVTGAFDQTLTNISSKSYKILRLKLRTAWGGNPDGTPLSKAGTLKFTYSDSGFTLYEIQGDDTGARIDSDAAINVPTGGISQKDYALVTNENFTEPGGIRATFTWDNPPRTGDKYSAVDDIRLIPTNAELLVDLDVDTDNDGAIDPSNEESEDLIEAYAPGVIIRIDRHEVSSNADELKRLVISPTHGEGTLKLEKTEGATCVKIWTDEANATEIESGKTWTLGTDTVPFPLYLDGIALGAGKLKLTHTLNNVETVDEVVFHVTETTSFTPRSSFGYSWEPDDLDHIAVDDVVEETSGDHDQGFVWKRFWDTVPPDGEENGIFQCTFERLKQCKDAGILAVHAHGNAGFFVGIRRQTELEVRQWLGIGATDEPPNGIKIRSSDPVGTYYAAITTVWLEQNWKPARDENKAIGLFFGCHSAEEDPMYSSLTAKAGGRVNFGYPAETDAVDDAADATKLLRRMNGRLGNGALRTARQAYGAGQFQGELKMSGNPDVEGWTTLCPAAYDHFPKPAAPLYTAGGSRLGFGCIIFDTHMDASISADSAITKTAGNGTIIGSRYWLNDYGCGFRFQLPSGETMSMAAVPDFCRNAGRRDQSPDGRRYLDGDRIAPNFDISPWGF